MRIRGVHYDIGTTTLEGDSTRPTLSDATIARELEDIRNGLRATAVRITGSDLDRLARAASTAAGNGLEVWLSPMLPNADAAATLDAVATAAATAAELRRNGSTAVLVVGCELSVFMSGILPGATHGARLALLADPAALIREVRAAGLDPQAAFADILRQAAHTARAHFTGQITYAAGAWEDVDWSIFDVVGVDAYRDAGNRATWTADLAAKKSWGRPIVITEFGCATYRGAADAGGMAWTAVERDTEPRRLRTGVARDERAQAAELTSLLASAEAAGVAGAFVYTYVAPSYPSSTDPNLDLDTASFALVRSWPDGRTEPKAAHRAVAAWFAFDTRTPRAGDPAPQPMERAGRG